MSVLIKDMDKADKACMELCDMLDRELPSAQPEKRTKEHTETHACDCIERKAAIRWVKTECNPYGKPTLDFESGKKVIEHLKQMPSAQVVITCDGCKFVGTYDTDFPCHNCIRREKDYYAQE